ncbi:16255_t:CDS:2 [Funneliformis geosporum]|nr:16255_t:CDS:2 [Funneliformis geosporum]
MVKRTATQILESPINKEIKLSCANIWGYLISSRGVITLDKIFYMFGDNEELEGNYMYLEGCEEVFFAGINYVNGIQRKEKNNWVKVALKERFVLQDGMILLFKRRQGFEIYEFRSDCGCKTCVVKAHEIFQDYESKNNYLIMDWIRYKSLSTWIKKKGQDKGDIIRNIIKCLGPVLNSIHERGWLHRDIKPENILVENESPLVLLITDFGMSCKISSNPSDKNGTPLFCAPEVWQNNPQNESTDWWSMGHLIYCCYEGEYLLKPVKLGLKEMLMEIEHRLQTIKDGDEPVINKMIEGGHEDGNQNTV